MPPAVVPGTVTLFLPLSQLCNDVKYLTLGIQIYFLALSVKQVPRLDNKSW